jgi:hypothetical protein
LRDKVSDVDAKISIRRSQARAVAVLSSANKKRNGLS